MAATLQLEKSTVSRLLDRLSEKGLLTVTPSARDKRAQDLELTASGARLYGEIERFADAQVSAALEHLPGSCHDTVRLGLELYAAALQGEKPKPEFQIQSGYTPGILAAVTEFHALYYAQNFEFGAVFERKVATEMAEFLARVDHPQNEVFYAAIHGRVVGSVSIDGEDLADGVAHLRWFIVGDQARGTGMGQRLLAEALRFVDDMGFAETQLWTFRGLQAARHLYEQAGFVLVEEKPGQQWGKEVSEQKFLRPHGASGAGP
ncbi:Transcriptional regulator, MarR family [Candidatus Rhodobacter oscarellae]|uniref:Transcriptional regulator, MarR family n=1 Tax=Candidatus Rhodobacter oscarellae TaxID=1675527 RepID=A0A0J9EA69_9RHOB|nr:Transcriptional regulator, MarR family [Candidatus Rhodobacter lobularis]